MLPPIHVESHIFFSSMSIKVPFQNLAQSERYTRNCSGYCLEMLQPFVSVQKLSRSSVSQRAEEPRCI